MKFTQHSKERHDNGTFTDHGHLTLRVGELFVQHMLYERKFVEELGALESGKLSVLNIRDAIPLDKSDAANYANLPRIEAYISTTDRAALLKSLPKHSDGTIDWPAITQSIGTTIQSEVKATFHDLADMFMVKDKGQKQPEEDVAQLKEEIEEEQAEVKEKQTEEKQAAEGQKQGDGKQPKGKKTQPKDAQTETQQQQSKGDQTKEQATTQATAAEIDAIIKLVDMHKMLQQYPNIRAALHKVYKIAEQHGLSKNRIATIIGNALITVHDSPPAVAQHANIAAAAAAAMGAAAGEGAAGLGAAGIGSAEAIAASFGAAVGAAASLGAGAVGAAGGMGVGAAAGGIAGAAAIGVSAGAAGASVGAAVGSAAGGAAADGGLAIAFELVESSISAKDVGAAIWRVGKHFVKLSPAVKAALLAYEIGSYLVDTLAQRYATNTQTMPEYGNTDTLKDTIEATLEATTFAKEILDKAYKAAKDKDKSAKDKAAKSKLAGQTTPASPDPNDDDEGDKEKSLREESRRNEERNVFDRSYDEPLSEHEGGKHNGHTVDRHVGRTQEQMQRRIDVEDMKQVTSYKDYESAERFTKETMKANKDEIMEWFKNAKDGDKKGFQATFNEETGYGLRRGSNVLEPKFKVMSVFKKVGDAMKVFTSYPID